MNSKFLVTNKFIFYIFLIFVELLLYMSSGSAFVISQKIMLGLICLDCILKGIKQRFIVNPYFCLILTPLSLLIYDPTVSTRFLTNLDNLVYCVAICSFYSFLAGLELYVSKISLDSEQNKKDSYNADILSDIGIEYFRIGTILAMIWFMYYVAKNLIHITVPFSAVFVQLVYVAIAFLLKSKKKNAYLLVGIMTIVMLTSNFRKTAFLYIFILVVLSMLNDKKTSTKTMIISFSVMILGGAFMIFFAYPLKMYFSANGSFSGLSGGFSSLITIMEQESVGYGDIGGSVFALRPYLSMTTEWTNLNFVINTQPNSTHGMWFVRPILNILQVNTSNLSVYELFPRSNYYNTFGFLTIQIKDFGFVGAVILTFFLGGFTGWCYKKFRENPNSTIETTRYVFVSCSVLEMFFSNHFLLGGVHIVYLVTWMIMCILKRTNQRVYTELKKSDKQSR